MKTSTLRNDQGEKIEARAYRIIGNDSAERVTWMGSKSSFFLVRYWLDTILLHLDNTLLFYFMPDFSINCVADIKLT